MIAIAVCVAFHHLLLLHGTDCAGPVPYYFDSLLLFLDFLKLIFDRRFRFLEDIFEVDRDCINLPQIRFSELLCLTVAFQSFVILQKSKFITLRTYHLEEFLLNAEVMVSNREHSNPVFELLLDGDILLGLLFLLVTVWQEVLD